VPIYPLEQFEKDLAEDRRSRAEPEATKTVVVRFGAMRLIGEYPFRASIRPGCGSRLICRTHRGTELATVLTSTCPNAGCSHSITRQEMLEYIENSGGRAYPFFTNGRALRVASPEDLQAQARLDESVDRMTRETRRAVADQGLKMRVVRAEPILGGETLTFFYTAEGRVDFRDLVQRLSDEHRTRIEMRQIGARDEARLNGDYERCGQHCCCRQFLKVLKPVSMKSAKLQKATLDPLKISGRCGRLMCCLRYEDKTYEELKRRLPHRRSHVGTPEGDGIVLNTQILTQLVLVRLDADSRDVAVPVEELTEAGLARPEPTAQPAEAVPSRGSGGESSGSAGDRSRRPRRRRRRRADSARQKGSDRPPPTPPDRPSAQGGDAGPAAKAGQQPDQPAKRKRRRRRRRNKPGPGPASNPPPDSP